MQLQIQGAAICCNTSQGELMLQLMASPNKAWHGNCKMGCGQRSMIRSHWGDRNASTKRGIFVEV